MCEGGARARRRWQQAGPGGGGAWAAKEGRAVGCGGGLHAFSTHFTLMARSGPTGYM
jgi:hypothetical protein